MIDRLVRVLALVALLVPAGAPGDEPAAANATECPPYKDFLVIPLRVHILTASDLPEVDCHLTDADIARILRKVNGIWDKAGVHWGLESIRREPAARQERYRLARDLGSARNLAIFRLLIPAEGRELDGLNVYYIHKFPVNGVWMGEDFAIVQETARLRAVDPGIDEPIPRVTAHELGHALGLAHRQDRTNLLASGTTGILLNVAEVATARREALRQKGVATTDRLREEAREATSRGDRERATRLWTWLSEIPGEGAAEARKRLDELAAGGAGRAVGPRTDPSATTPGGEGESGR